MDRDEIVRLDKAHVWHPYTAMDDYVANVDPIVVKSAKGAWLFDVDGKRYLDGNSSWWVAGLGHGHPRILRALREQSEVLAHCSLAGTTHEPAARLAAELVETAPRGLTRVFYTDNGSTAIDAAVKMAVQFWRQSGKEKKTRFLALDGAFHGDTLGATSLGGVEVFRRPFGAITFDCVHVPFPAPDAHARAFEAMETIVRAEKDTVAAVVVESIVQGAAGMRMYEPSYLRSLRRVCDENDVLLIVDEVFAGYGRTGTMWACEHAGVRPDIMCIGKAFAAILPMAAVLTTDRVFDAFRGASDRAFYYGLTFCGNPLGAALAREVLAIYRDEKIVQGVNEKAPRIRAAFDRIGKIDGVVRTRALGMIGAADLAGGSGYLSSVGWRVYAEARKRGAYLRPLGDTVYVCPPLTIEEGELEELLGVLEESVRAARG
jgi:adenosylmethionine-8-amino-7-oxononanoate aminotransferase